MGDSIASRIGSFFSDQKDLVVDYWTKADDDGASTLDKISGAVAEQLEPVQNSFRNAAEKLTETRVPAFLSLFSKEQDPVSNIEFETPQKKSFITALSRLHGAYQDWGKNSLSKQFKSEEDLEELLENLPYEALRDVIYFQYITNKSSKDSEQVRHVNQLFDRISLFAQNPGKKDKLKIDLKVSEEVNPQHTGVTIYPTTKMLEVLTDDEFTAYMAHEMAHADLNHNIGTLGQMLVSSAAYFGNVTSQGFFWLFTGVELENLKDVREHGMISSLLAKGTSVDASYIEMQADLYALEVMKKAGIPPNALKSAIVKSSLYSSGAEIDNQDISELLALYDANDFSSDKIRQYPDLLKRLENIDRVISDHSQRLVALTSPKQQKTR